MVEILREMRTLRKMTLIIKTNNKIPIKKQLMKQQRWTIVPEPALNDLTETLGGR